MENKLETLYLYIYIDHLIDIVKSERSELNDTFRRSEKSDSELSLGGNKDCLCIYLVKEVLSAVFRVYPIGIAVVG
ncbi:Uncharacterised protein [Streptococcus dysgalactiae subsp. equisimilis]|uniref:Uncharacterized protein n=1 Tax=Streptococcus dysgalactiae TaxID=1334 RepID=A0A9X9SHU0_STRDY|nr:Uncharacterised protein [Streptococcus dysgalactiae subsp. equisimilis]VTS47704.1 Uncharacterised protein [Streptococcus dysgalactiae subsp. equisimilis]VTS77740.1 Uncharacterised protein [Streptococcus dysgalactiae]